MNQEQFIQERKFWERILGEKRVREMEKNFESINFSSKVELPAELCSIYEDISAANCNKWQEKYQNNTFGKFFCFFMKIGVEYAKIKYPDVGRFLIKYEDILAENFYIRIKKIPVRVLIYDMHECEEKHLLTGNDSKEKYEYYNQVFLGNYTYIRNLGGKYPEMLRLMLLVLVQVESFMEEIVNRFNRDWGKLKKTFSGKQDVLPQIQNLKMGLSDRHFNGRTVAKLTLENSLEIIYKPHGLKKEILYEGIFNRLEEKCGLTLTGYSNLDCHTYGWQEFLKKGECQSEEQVKRYYRRMGIHMFLCMILAGTDMHGENIMSCGEHPIVIDLETVPGVYDVSGKKDITEYARQILNGSVVHSGILPVMVWGGKNGAGINVSAISKNQKQKMPFYLPYVQNDKTVDMKIGYQRMMFNMYESLPVLNGEIREPLEYQEEIRDGFATAYKIFQKNRQLIEPEIKTLLLEKSRYLMRHTQQYTMYLSTSLHPDFMKDTKRRFLMLHALKKETIEDGEFWKKVSEYEIQALMDMDIPYFQMQGNNASFGEENEKNLVNASNDVEPLQISPNFMKNSALETYEWRVEQMGEKDLQCQIMFIELSMALLKEDSIDFHKLEKAMVDLPSEEVVKTKLQESICQLADWICDHAIVNKMNEEVTWIGVHHLDEKQWKIAVVNPYLYDGLAGITVFLSMLTRVISKQRYQRIYNMALNTLYKYSDSITENKNMGNGKDKLQVYQMGALVGEGSVILAYLLLYQITGDEKNLDYAEKHSEIIKKFYKKDQQYDYLSGNAGAITAILELYKLRPKESYLELAEQMGAYLWEKAVKTEDVCGWATKDIPVPLAGRSHGNSGYMMAYTTLLEITHKPQYKEIIEKLLAYENKLYSEKLHNWMDLRRSEHTDLHCMNTWCHGAPGILLTRMKLADLHEFQNNEIIKRDIQRAAEALFSQTEVPGLCICHGFFGNYWIKRMYMERLIDRNIIDYDMKKEFLAMVSLLSEKELWIPQEQYNPGLMTGIAGIGAVLIRNYRIN